MFDKYYSEVWSLRSLRIRTSKAMFAYGKATEHVGQHIARGDHEKGKFR